MSATIPMSGGNIIRDCKQPRWKKRLIIELPAISCTYTGAALDSAVSNRMHVAQMRFDGYVKCTCTG